ncbi:YopX family protein [Lactiplantibacillus plantarum]|uniref:YopX family protein n=1 Tax=Lactiplantibacillus plantarum TaxID=1590 RepID=UPI003F5369B7
MIKFRAWDNECKVIRGYDELKGLTFDALDASDFKLEQFTGLKDMNGKDIYVGDIVENERGEILRVSYSAIDASFVAGNCYFGSIGAGKEIRIIGNVHANQELLKG